MNSIKRFLFRLGLFCLLPLPFLFALDKMVEKGLRRSNYKYYAEWNDLYNSRINADVLILGSSRAFKHISPHILDSVLNTNSYNLGIDGWSFRMQYAKTRIYLQHNKKPRYIIQVLDEYTLRDIDDLYNYQQFLPYLQDTIIQSVTRKYNGHFGPVEYYFPLLKYINDKQLITLGLNNFWGLGKNERNDHKGYSPSDQSFDSSFHFFKHFNPHGVQLKTDKELKNEFAEFLDYCKQENIKVIFVYCPEYYEARPYMKGWNEIMNTYKYYAASYSIPFLNYADDSISYNRSMFYNSMHMNKKGAEAFSEKLANDLKPYIGSKH